MQQAHLFASPCLLPSRITALEVMVLEHIACAVHTCEDHGPRTVAMRLTGFHFQRH